MQVKLPEDAERLSVAAGFASVDQYVFSLVQKDRERLAIQEGIDALAEHRVQDFEEFDREFRKTNGIEK
ncbi:hypothetical protein ACFL2H_03925 [Planctomycetota bacterium]